jgi:hypothetical protein
MKWKKLGQIFEFNKSTLTNTFVSHAQSPQAIIHDDFVRIYFSTRKSDANFYYLSHIQYIDMDIEMKTILHTSNHEVIPKGDVGCFDEHGIFPISPIRVDDIILAYTSGWARRTAVSVETGIGLAVSDNDGYTFKRFGKGPVLTSSLNEPFLIVDGFVRSYNGVFYMFYIFGKKWTETIESAIPERIYKIALATSVDGINWKKNDGNQIIDDVIGDEECQALPTVINRNGIYHMYFCYRFATDFRSNPDRGYRLGYAYSTNLIDWVRDDKNSGMELGKPGEWDSDMMCYPHLMEIHNKVYLLYNGNNFGKDGFGLAELIES